MSLFQTLLLLAIASAVLGAVGRFAMDRADRRAELERIQRRLDRRREREAAIRRGDLPPDAPKPMTPRAIKRRRR